MDCKEEWYLSSDGEYYGPGAYGSRDEAVNAGWEMYRQVRDGEREWNDLYPDGIDADSVVAPTYYVGRRQDWWPAVDEDYMLDCVAEQAQDYAGEFADGWLRDVGEGQRGLLRSMLQEAFDKWLAETGNEPAFFMVELSEEVDPRRFEVEGFAAAGVEGGPR